jgi:hypothetical protein
MNFVTLGIGGLAVGYGVYTAYLRKKDPSQFKKLAAMKKAYGEKRGDLIHFCTYTLFPVIGGLWLILRGIQGWALL